jgi:hypothetical protein
MTSFRFSQATIDDVLCGTTVRAVVTKEFVTVQQEHTEYVKVCQLKESNKKKSLSFNLVTKSHYTDC